MSTVFIVQHLQQPQGQCFSMPDSSRQSLQCFIDMLLRFKLVVEDQFDNAVLANDISLPALKKPQEILFHAVLLAHLLEGFVVRTDCCRVLQVSNILGCLLQRFCP